MNIHTHYDKKKRTLMIAVYSVRVHRVQCTLLEVQSKWTIIFIKNIFILMFHTV